VSGNGFPAAPKSPTTGRTEPDPAERASRESGAVPERAELNWNDLQFEPLASRPSKVGWDDLGHPAGPNPSFEAWLEGLPRLLGAAALKQLRDAIVRAWEEGRPVLAALGGHVIKTGCAPYLIDWMEHGVLRGLALNGAAAIHDLELAVAGQTSEEVGPRLMAGTFGFARETSDLFAAACTLAATRSIGLGAALGEVLLDQGGPGAPRSLLAVARRAGIPLTVHVAIGTDIVHMNPRLEERHLGKPPYATSGRCAPWSHEWRGVSG